MRGAGRDDAAFALARAVVAEGEREHDGEPENGADDDELRALGAVAGVHEIENDERGLEGGDGESDNDIPLAEILVRSDHGEKGAQHEGAEDGEIDFR